MEQRDIEFFKMLSETDTGRVLLDIFKRLEDSVYDSRKWDKDTTRESANLAAKVIRENLIDRIRIPGPNPGGGRSEFE